MEFYFYRDLYCDRFAVQGCGLELPRLDSVNRFFVKTMPDWFYDTDVTRASVGFNDDAQKAHAIFPLLIGLLGNIGRRR